MNFVPEDNFGFSEVGDTTECTRMKYQKKLQTIGLLKILRTILNSHWNSLQKMDCGLLQTNYGWYTKWIPFTKANKIAATMDNHFSDIADVKNQIYDLTGNIFVSAESFDDLISKLESEYLNFKCNNN